MAKKPTLDRDGESVFHAMMQTVHIILKNHKMITRKEFKQLEKGRELALKCRDTDRYFDEIMQSPAFRNWVEQSLKQTAYNEQFTKDAKQAFESYGDSGERYISLMLGINQVKRLYDWYKKRGFKHAEAE